MKTDFQLDNFLPYRLSVLTNTVSRTLAKDYAQRLGISVAEWRVIAVTGHYAPLSANQVCDRTAMDKVAVSRAVKSLLGKGMLLRRSDPQDGRRSLLSLSVRGKAVHERIAPQAQRLQQQLLSALSRTEQRQLDGLLDKLTGCAQRLDTSAP